MDRNQLEQEAIKELNRGSQEGALRAYSAILKLDPRDRRIRQKVGELLLKLGRPVEAEKQLREVAEGLVKEGAHRAAVAVLKQLVALRGDDAGLQMELAECYVASGYPNDARQHFDTAMRLYIGTGRALDAAKAARRLAEQSPGEPAMKLKVAELLEAGGDAAGAANVYQDVAEEYRRRGRPDEVGRIAEMALRLRPDDVGLLLDAAAARVAAAEWKRALAHLQLAFSVGPREPRTLDLLSRALEGVGQPEKALKVLTELARVAGERQDATLEADALRRAARLSPADGDLRRWLEQAEERLARTERRVTQLTLGQAANEDELRVLVKAEVYTRYRFPDRAHAALTGGLAQAPRSTALLAAMAELEAGRGRTAEALALLNRLLPLVESDQEAEAVRERITVLGGTPAEVEELDLDADTQSHAVIEPDPPPFVSGEVDSATARGDRLAAAGDLPGAMMAYREALAANPLDEGVLSRIASLRTASRAAPPPPPPEPEPEPAAQDDDAFADFGVTDGTFAEVLPEALDEVPEGDLTEARSLVAVGMWQDALALLEAAATLEGHVLRAQAIRGLGDVSRALDALRDAVNDAMESDPAYCDALFELSALYTATGKARAALRLLEELKDLDAGYRVTEVDARMRGLSKLVK